MAERVDKMINQIAIAASPQAAADQSSARLDSIPSLSHDTWSRWPPPLLESNRF